MDDPGRDQVEAALERLEAHHDIHVLAASDLGSRAWGLADTDSDYDVAVVFAQDPIAYATLAGPTSSLEYRFGACDCHGWDARRFAELLAESNPSAFELLHSPVQYRTCSPVERLVADVGDSFTPIALYHHYRSLATRQYRTYLQGRLLEDGQLVALVDEEWGEEYLVRPVDDGVGESFDQRIDDDGLVTVPRGVYDEASTDRTVKRHLVVSRGVLCAHFVRETHRFPPFDVEHLLEAARERDWLATETIETIHSLVASKRRGEGDAVIDRQFHPDEIELPVIDPADHAGRGVDRDRLDEFIRETLETRP